MSYASNLIHLPGLLFKVVVDVWKQKRFIKKKIQPILQQFRQQNDGSISDTDFKKIINYYGFGTTAVLAENVATLRRKKLTVDERWASTCQGAITGLFDDFFDEKGVPQDTLLRFIETPDTVPASDKQEELFLHFYKETLKGAHHPPSIIHYFKKVNENQIDSLLQTQPATPFEKIMQITHDKGGNSVLFYRALLQPEMKDAEVVATYQMGALMQMANDIFDVYKDTKAGVRTLINSGLSITEVRTLFSTQMDVAFQQYANMPYAYKAKRSVMRKLSFGISRVYVALDQYEKLEQASGGKFSPEAYSRSQLICDMETLPNLCKSIRHYLNYTLPS